MHPLPYAQGLSAGMAPMYMQTPLGAAMYGPPSFSATQPGLPPPYLRDAPAGVLPPRSKEEAINVTYRLPELPRNHRSDRNAHPTVASEGNDGSPSSSGTNSTSSRNHDRRLPP